jgi:hypothetical protein
MVKYTVLWCITPIKLEKDIKITTKIHEKLRTCLIDDNLYLWFSKISYLSHEKIIFIEEKEQDISKNIVTETHKNLQKELSNEYTEDIIILPSIKTYDNPYSIDNSYIYSFKYNINGQDEYEIKLKKYGFGEHQSRNWSINDKFKKIINGDRSEIYIKEEEKIKNNIVPKEITYMRSWNEIITKCKEQSDNYFFSYADTLIDFLPHYYAKNFLSIEYMHDDWEKNIRIQNTKEGINIKIFERCLFLEEKIEANRNMSIGKICFQIKILFWLLGKDIDLDDYTASELLKHARSTAQYKKHKNKNKKTKNKNKKTKNERIEKLFEIYALGKYNKIVFWELFDFNECLNKWINLKTNKSRKELKNIIKNPRVCDYKKLMRKDRETEDLWFIKEFGNFFVNYREKENKLQIKIKLTNVFSVYELCQF